MLKHKIAGIALLSIITLWPALSYGASLGRAIGGRVTSVPSDLQATITCAASYGPFLMLPFNAAVPGPYFIRATNRGTPKRSGYLLGNYSVTPDTGTCYNPETGAPIPAFEIKLYGVSR